MRIAINAATLRGFGSTQLGVKVVESLLSNCKHEFLVWVPENWNGSAFANKRLYLSRAGTINKLVRENCFMPIISSLNKVDAMFSLGDTGPIFLKQRHLLLVQQAFLVHDPSYYPFNISNKMKLKIGLMHSYFKLGMRSVQLYTVQSKFMKSRLCDYWSLPEEKVIVQPTPIDLGHMPEARPTPGRVLWLTSDGPHKALNLLPSIAENLLDSGVDLHITLPKSSVSTKRLPQKQLKLLTRVNFLGYLSHTEVLNSLAKAQLVFLPSQLESFGMTYYEAMGLGVPIVAADMPFSREAMGNAALYCSNNASEYVNGILKVGSDARLRERMIAMGRSQFSKKTQCTEQITQNYISMIESMGV